MARVAPFATGDPPVQEELLIQRLLSAGVPMQYLVNKQVGLSQFLTENKMMIQDVLAALLPEPKELDLQEVSSATQEWLEGERGYIEGILWIQWAEYLMFDGDPEERLKIIVNETGQVRGVCGAVWGSNDIAYRCRTCEKDPTCAICVPCFEAGNHENHDYSMIHTGGGCCDCGDITAWSESGFCSRHRGPGQAPTLPEELVSTFVPIMEALIIGWGRKLQTASTFFSKSAKKWSEQSGEEKVVTHTSIMLVQTLLKFCNCSESLLTCIGGLLASEKAGLLDILLKPEWFLPNTVLDKLHELLFKLMGDPSFKYEFAKVFVTHYPAAIHAGLSDDFQSSNRNQWRESAPFCSFSVQIFTVPTLTPHLVTDFRLMDMLLGSMKDLLLACKDDEGRFQVNRGPLLSNSYIRIMEDMRFVLRNAEVSEYVAQKRPDLVRTWLQLLAYIQGMDSQRRQTNIHVEEETESWLTAYLLEVQMASLHPLFIDGAAKTDYFEDKKHADQWEDISCRESLEDSVHGHAKIGRTSTKSDVSGKVGTSYSASSMDIDNGDESVSSKFAATTLTLGIPSRLIWLISECCKVLQAWLLIDSCRATKSDMPPEGPQQRKLILFADRGLILDPQGLTLNDRTANDTFMFRDWLRANNHANLRLSQDIAGSTENEQNQDDSEYWWTGIKVQELCSVLQFNWRDKGWLLIDYDVSQQEVSLHVPLHRFLAMTLKKSLETSPDMISQECKKSSWYSDFHTSESGFMLQLFPENYRVPSFASMVMEHPLRIQVFVAQYRAGMWRRNGQTVQALCENYLSVRWCEDSSDLDLFLLQCCAVMSPPEQFVDRIISRFGLADYFSSYLLRPNEYEPTLTQHMLSLLIRIVVERGFCGFNTGQVCRRELIRRLAISDATHSQLMKSLPARLHEKREWQEILCDIANYYKPSGMQQGRFSLRQEYWKELDLYHPRWNAKELQLAEDRYMHVCKASAIIKQLPQWRDPFPPFKNLAKIATCAKVLDILRSILFHAVFSEQISESRSPENVLFTALHLLALGLDVCSLFTFNKNLPYSQSELTSAYQDMERPPPLVCKATERVYFGGADGADLSKRQSLISLLVLLKHKYSKGEAVGGEDTQRNVVTLLRSLLKKFSDLHDGCMYEVESLAPDILHRVSNEQDKKGFHREQLSEDEKRRIVARERQAAIMARMKAQQEKFASTLVETEEDDDMRNSAAQMKTSAVSKLKEERVSQSAQSSSTVVCSLCRDFTSDSPTSYLTLVQKSRILAISVKGIPQWDKAPGLENEEMTSLTAELGRESASSQSSGHESLRTELLNLIQMALNGEMEQGAPAEVAVLMQLLQDEFYAEAVEVPESFPEARMSETSSSDSGSDDLGEGENGFGIGESPRNFSNCISNNSQKEVGRFEDGNEQKRHSCLLNTLLEYASILSRNHKRGHQLGAENLSGALRGPHRQSSVRSSAIEGLWIDNLGSDDNVGVHISSCGHAVHKGCLDRYLSSLVQRFQSRTLFEGLQIVDPNQGEFLCPVCRRLANSVLPYIPEGTPGNRKEDAGIISSMTPKDSGSGSIFYLQHAISLLRSVEGQLWQSGSKNRSHIMAVPKVLKPAFECLISRLCTLFFPEKESNLKSDSCRVSQSLLLWDVLRYTMMSTELATRTLINKSSSFGDALSKAVEKGHVLPLMVRAAKSVQNHNRQSILLTARGTQLLVCSICFGVSKDFIPDSSMPGSVLKLLNLIDNGRESADVQFWKRTADPILAHDPFSSLMWLVFCLPSSYSFSKEPFRALVHLLYLVCLVQTMGSMGESLLSNISGLHVSDSTSSFIWKLLTVLSNVPIFTGCGDLAQSSSDSIASAIRRFTVPYLRRCALLEVVLFGACSTESISSGIKEHNSSKSPLNDASEDMEEVIFLEQKFSVPSLEVILQDEYTQEVLLRWCEHLLKEYGPRKLLPIPRPVTAAPFKLMALPQLYQTLLQRYIKERCPLCKNIPEQPALCLLCGRLCCGASRKGCCSSKGKSECYKHALTCGGGVGVYLMIRRTNILLQRCARQTTWPSPYLDAYGEEDIEMQRGKPLYLSEERYASLTAMVVSHGLDHSSQVLSHTTWETLIMG